MTKNIPVTWSPHLPCNKLNYILLLFFSKYKSSPSPHYCLLKILLLFKLDSGSLHSSISTTKHDI